MTIDQSNPIDDCILISALRQTRAPVPLDPIHPYHHSITPTIQTKPPSIYCPIHHPHIRVNPKTHEPLLSQSEGAQSISTIRSLPRSLSHLSLSCIMALYSFLLGATLTSGGYVYALAHHHSHTRWARLSLANMASSFESYAPSASYHQHHHSASSSDAVVRTNPFAADSRQEDIGNAARRLWNKPFFALHAWVVDLATFQNKPAK